MMRRLAIVLLLSGLASLMVLPAIAEPPGDCNGILITDARATDGADFLTGTDDRDVVALGTGDDQYFAAASGDVLCGNDGDDVVVGEDGPDSLDGGPGDDIVVGMTGQDVLRAGNGADVLKGGKGDDALRSVSLDDVQDDLYDGPGTDTIYGSSEDVWHRCDDGSIDNHDLFAGIIVPDPDC